MLLTNVYDVGVMERSPLEIASQVKRLREERGWSQGQLSFRAGVLSSHISMIERGIRVPKYETLRKIAAAFDVSVAELTGEETPRERALRIAEEALDYGMAQPRSEDAVAVTPRPGSETTQQMIRRHFPNASPEEFEELQALVARFMQHNIQEMRAINRVGDVIVQLAKERSGEGGGDEDGESAEDAKRKPFRGPPEEFHGERFLETIRQAL